MPGREYQASRVCSEGVRSRWKQLAEMPAPQQDSCRIDHTSGKIICDTRMSCEGGNTHAIESFQHRHAMEYDCSECSCSQRGSCCRKCAELRDQARAGTLEIGSNRIYEVYCQRCGDGDLCGGSPSPVQCAHDPVDGQFKCTVAESCEPGQPKINAQNMSYSCVVTPCDTCTNDLLKAQCCYSCLNHFCTADLGFDNRKICRGCDEPGMVPMYEPAPAYYYEPPASTHYVEQEPYLEPYKPVDEPPPDYSQPAYGGPPPAQDWWSIRQALQWHSGHRGDSP